jgi:hypothetical protein
MNVNALLAAAIHERYSDGRVHAPCDHTSGGECERFADVLLATPSGQALVAHVTALETALRRMRHTHYSHQGVVVTHTGPEHLAAVNEVCDICAALEGQK